MRVLMMCMLLILVSCGKTTTLVNPAKPELYTYELYGENCSTGYHEYYYLNDVCDSLLHDEINNNCAIEERTKLYNSHCKGQFN